jgi:hypothetical protein
MPSTFSTSLRLELIGNGEQAANWGNTTNVNLGTLLEQAIAGTVSIAMSDANLTLTASNGISDQARNAVIELTGSLTATRDVIIPATSKAYIFRNQTNQSLLIRAIAGSGVTIPAGLTATVYWRGGNVIQATPSFNASTNSITSSLVGNVTGNVTGSASNNVLKAGDTMTGDLGLNKANPGLFLQKTASGQTNTIIGTLGANARWSMELGNPASETGSNAGSNFVLGRFNDAGTFIDAPLAISRATGGPVFNNVATWRTALAAPAIPTFVAGVAGEFVLLNPGLGAAAVIPANGTWAAYAVRYGDGNSWPFGVYDGNIFAGVYAGGLTVGAALADRFWLGFAWRIV